VRISARNVLKGLVVSIKPGAVNAEVVIELSGGDRVVSIISLESVKALDLAPGKTAYAVIKASNVMLGADH